MNEINKILFKKHDLPSSIPTNTETTSTLSNVSLCSEQLKLSDINMFIRKLQNSTNITCDNDNEKDCINKKKLNLNIKNIRLKPILSRNNANLFELMAGEQYEKDEHDFELEKFKVDTLNDGQMEIYNFIKENNTKIILIQAGPGCGKSYTLKTIAYNMPDIKFDTIIYKHDLLQSFKYNSRRWTVAKFAMATFGLKFFQYIALDKLLSSKMSSYEFILVIVSMLKRANIPNLKGGIVFIDEYTIISKPILLVILMLLEYHQIGVIICGDRNQLQNIYNSKHATLSSYRLASSFAFQQFHLNVNERCSNVEYNKFIDFIARYASSKTLDEFIFAIIAAVFLRQLIEPPNYNQIHLARTHQELSNIAHMMVCQHKYPSDFYMIDQSNLRSMDFMPRASNVLQPTKTLIEYMERVTRNEPPSIDKFLPYLPLVVGARYYVFKHSEYSQGVLLSINADESITLRMDNGSIVVTRRTTQDEVIFEQHRQFLLDGEPGKIYSYPIYPANFMSIHKCQGCTITDNLDLMFSTSMQYQGLYVAISRVTNPEQISRVTIPNQISFIISTIINFPQCVENNKINMDDIIATCDKYIYYNVNSDMMPFAPLISEFILNNNVDEKKQTRKKIIDLARHYPQHLISFKHNSDEESSNLLTMTMIIKYRDLFLGLACLDEIDRNVWIHEYLLCNPEMRCLLPQAFKSNSKSISQLTIRSLNELIKMANLNAAYDMEMSTIEYIESKSKICVRMTEEERNENAKFVIKAKDEYAFYECTEFCAKVYKKLKNEEQIMDSWLEDELNLMISTNNREDVTSTPIKTSNTNNNNNNNNNGLSNRYNKLQKKQQSLNDIFSPVKRVRKM